MNSNLVCTISQFTEEARSVLGCLGTVDYLNPTQSELEEIAWKYDAMVVGLGLYIDQKVIERAKNLKVIATATTSIDHIDVAAAESRGIKILSLRGEEKFLDTITGTAELAFGLMINLLRFIPCAFDSVKQYKWDRERFRGRNLYGKTLGIVGMGRLGRWMARYGSAFGMLVIFYDPHVDKSSLPECRKVSFNELLRESDVVSLHVHLSEDTENMFGAPEFEVMKNSAHLINTSRGKIVNEKDLLDALESKSIAGYAADVLADEVTFEREFSRRLLIEYAKVHRNLIIVPHIGGMTVESRETTDILMAEKLRGFLSVIKGDM